MRAILSRLSFDWRTLFSAVLIVLAFPPYGLSALLWICLIPWFFSIDSCARKPRPKRAAFAQGIWLSVWMSLLGFFWVGYVLKQFGHLPWILAAVGLLLYSFIGQPQFYLFAPIQVTLQKRLWRSEFQSTGKRAVGFRHGGGILVALLCGALAYAGLDWMIPKLFVDTLGHALYSAEYLRQIADLGGAPLLTFLVYFSNLLGWLFIRVFRHLNSQAKSRSFGKLMPATILLLVLLAAGTLYGKFRSDQIAKRLTNAHKNVRMSVIQANIGDIDKLAAEKGLRSAAREILRSYYSLSRTALEQTPKPEILIWPETSYPSTFRTPMTSDEFARDKQLESFVRRSGVPLLFGGYDHANGLDYNAFFLLEPNPSDGVLTEGKLQIYRKNILLLFGEYIPGSSAIPALKQMFPQVGNFGRGPGPEVYTVSLPGSSEGRASIRLAPMICYEILFPGYVISAARQDAQAIINITNDSWFGPWGEPQLHLALATFRSIETRLPIVRGTNTGISALILPNGEITHPTELFQSEILSVDVPVIEPVGTLMMRLGDWFAITSLLLGVVGLGVSRLLV